MLGTGPGITSFAITADCIGCTSSHVSNYVAIIGGHDSTQPQHALAVLAIGGGRRAADGLRRLLRRVQAARSVGSIQCPEHQQDREANEGGDDHDRIRLVIEKRGSLLYPPIQPTSRCSVAVAHSCVESVARIERTRRAFARPVGSVRAMALGAKVASKADSRAIISR